MTRLATAFIALACIACAAPAYAQRPPPACDDSQVREVLINVVKPIQIYETTAWRDMPQPSGGKRWCYMFFSGTHHPGASIFAGTPYQQVLFTTEWLNESDGRFWVDIKKRDRTCRGVSGNPWSLERCD